MKKTIAMLLAACALLMAGCTVKLNNNRNTGSIVTMPPASDPDPTATAVQAETAAPAESETAEPADSEIVLTKENFDAEIAGDTPILVDFWATWCGPCMQLAPIVEEFANESDGSYRVGKINVDEQPLLTQRFGIEAIPTLIVFQNGEEIARFVGLTDKAKLAELVGK